MIFLLLATTPLLLIAGDPDVALAIRHGQNAIMSYPEVKQYVKNIEKTVVNRLPIDREDAVFLGATAYSAVNKTLTTRPVKNLHIKTINNGNIRPDLYYNLKTNDTVLEIRANWSF